MVLRKSVAALLLVGVCCSSIKFQKDLFVVPGGYMASRASNKMAIGPSVRTWRYAPTRLPLQHNSPVGFLAGLLGVTVGFRAATGGFASRGVSPRGFARRAFGPAMAAKAIAAMAAAPAAARD